MALTGFWPVKSRLKDVLSYAENPEKTTDRDLSDVLRYAANEDKTERTLYVSAINCPKQRAYQCMIDTKKRFGKLGGNVAYHGVQSFKTGEVTPEEAHKIGMETAKRMWGDLYEVVVTTHLNTDNLHCHFVVNSVSFKTGRKFENHVSDHIKLREISDEVCREYGKSVIPFDHFYGNKKAYWIKESGTLSHREQLRRDLDEVLSKACTFPELYEWLESLGYRFVRDFSYEHASVIAEGWKRPVRIDSLGEKYKVDNIEDQLYENVHDPKLFYLIPAPRYREIMFKFRPKYKKAREENLIIVLLDIFIELLKIPLGYSDRQPDYRPMSPEIRAEVKKLEQYTRDVQFLSDHKIETYQDFLSCREKLTDRIEELKQERYTLRLKIRRARTPEEDTKLKEQCKELTKQITPLRKELKTTHHIEERYLKIKELLDKELQLEQKQYQPIRNKERGIER